MLEVLVALCVTVNIDKWHLCPTVLLIMRLFAMRQEINKYTIQYNTLQAYTHTHTHTQLTR